MEYHANDIGLLHASSVPVGCCAEQVTLKASIMNGSRLGLPSCYSSLLSVLGKKEFLYLVVDAGIC